MKSKSLAIKYNYPNWLILSLSTGDKRIAGGQRHFLKGSTTDLKDYYITLKVRLESRHKKNDWDYCSASI